MYTSTFTFAAGEFDEKFHALDGIIAQVAKSIPGYIGEESWQNDSTGLISNVYYWETLEALQALMTHPEHIKAKQAQALWLKGYQVVISKVVGSYSDNKIQHPLSSFKIPFEHRQSEKAS